MGTSLYRRPSPKGRAVGVPEVSNWEVELMLPYFGDQLRMCLEGWSTWSYHAGGDRVHVYLWSVVGRMVLLGQEMWAAVGAIESIDPGNSPDPN
jgi:hypothetical protein